MDDYIGITLVIMTCKIYATKTNKHNIINISNIALDTINSYTPEEFTELLNTKVNKLINNNNNNPLEIFNDIKQQLIQLQKTSENLVPINQLISKLTDNEIDELIETVTATITNPGAILF
jgi:hypothetical protein